MTPGRPPDEPAPDLGPLEAALRSLVPGRAAIDRDRVLFEAGRASARGRSRLPWPAIAAALALVAGSEGAILATRPPTRVVERVVVVREPGPVAEVARRPDPPPAPKAIGAGLGLTERDRLAGRLIRFGLDGLGPTRSVGSAFGSGSASPRRLLRDELRKSLNLGDPS